MPSSQTIKIEFIRDYTVQNEARRQYKAGQVETMNEASALHFISRGAAVVHGQKEPAAPADTTASKTIKKKTAKKKATKKAD